MIKKRKVRGPSRRINRDVWLDKTLDWDALEERAAKHFARRDDINAAPKPRMAAHPCSERIKESESMLFEAARQGRRGRDNALGAMRGEAMRSRREANHER